MEWQSSIEINRILSLTWGEVAGIWKGEYPLKLEFFYRKRHVQTYHTYLGKDSIEHLKLWREEWKRLYGGSPEDGDLIFAGKRSTGTSDSSLNERPKRMAMQLHRAGKAKNSNPSSWHSHPLRSSFEIEGSHAGVPKQVRGYFEGHLADIMWVYNHRDEIYPEDLVREYQKIEPFVSLDPDEVAIRKKVEGEQSEEIQKLRNDVALLTRAVEEVSAGRVKLMPPPGQ